jgi:hypothetical protein
MCMVEGADRGTAALRVLYSVEGSAELHTTAARTVAAVGHTLVAGAVAADNNSAVVHRNGDPRYFPANSVAEDSSYST